VLAAHGEVRQRQPLAHCRGDLQHHVVGVEGAGEPHQAGPPVDHLLRDGGVPQVFGETIEDEDRMAVLPQVGGHQSERQVFVQRVVPAREERIPGVDERDSELSHWGSPTL